MIKGNDNLEKAMHKRASIGLDINRERVRLGWTRYKLAKKAGISQIQVANMESGETNFTVDKMLQVLYTLGFKVKIIPR